MVNAFTLALNLLFLYCWDNLKRSFSSEIPFLSTSDRDLDALTTHSGPCDEFFYAFKTHLSPTVDVVVIVILSKSALIGGCLIPDLVTGPLHSNSAVFINRFIACVNKVAEMVQPVIMSLSGLCHAVIDPFQIVLILKVLL